MIGFFLEVSIDFKDIKYKKTNLIKLKQYIEKNLKNKYSKIE